MLQNTAYSIIMNPLDKDLCIEMIADVTPIIKEERCLMTKFENFTNKLDKLLECINNLESIINEMCDEFDAPENDEKLENMIVAIHGLIPDAFGYTSHTRQDIIDIYNTFTLSEIEKKQLVNAIINGGTDAINRFLDREVEFDTRDAAIAAIEETICQMPDEELRKFRMK